MALEVPFCVHQNDSCQEVCIEDLTGVFSATNPGGFGAPNPVLPQVNSDTMTISQLTDLATNTYTQLGDPVEMWPTLPNFNEITFCISTEDVGLGVGSSWAAGIYKFVRTVSYSGNVVTYTKYVVLKCTLDCCAKELAAEYASCSCGCDGPKEKFQDVMFHMRALDAAICCSNFAAIEKEIEYLNKRCTDCGCGCS